eukprot:gnl/TRDRNA2_/TRDRNA2_182451_c0_seq1.p1 gnl/TRDRNA2_/TRDRNA2_182451_c0~~gnl/TRDRNA2_/TRDRNA2_182451_c0_seq1.p1  ORF type:complete len:599 (-),score=114.22 gnl/TRDRNA2_/TRDRNA2_182451_c0_seq1:42-1838(-)
MVVFLLSTSAGVAALAWSGYAKRAISRAIETLVKVIESKVLKGCRCEVEDIEVQVGSTMVVSLRGVKIYNLKQFKSPLLLELSTVEATVRLGSTLISALRNGGKPSELEILSIDAKGCTLTYEKNSTSSNIGMLLTGIEKTAEEANGQHEESGAAGDALMLEKLKVSIHQARIDDVQLKLATSAGVEKKTPAASVAVKDIVFSECSPASESQEITAVVYTFVRTILMTTMSNVMELKRSKHAAYNGMEGATNDTFFANYSGFLTGTYWSWSLQRSRSGSRVATKGEAPAVVPAQSAEKVAMSFFAAAAIAGNQLEAMKQLRAAESVGPEAVKMLDSEPVAKVRYIHGLFQQTMELLQPKDFKGKGWCNNHEPGFPDVWALRRPDGSCQAHMSQTFDNMSALDFVLVLVQNDYLFKHFCDKASPMIQEGQTLAHNGKDASVTYNQIKDEMKGKMDRVSDMCFINACHDPLAKGIVYAMHVNNDGKSVLFPEQAAPSLPKGFVRQQDVFFATIARPLPGNKTEVVQVCQWTPTSAEQFLIKWMPAKTFASAVAKALGLILRRMPKAMPEVQAELPERYKSCPYKAFYDSARADVEQKHKA